MEVSVEIPADIDGYVSRECPACEGRFKWFVGRLSEAPDDWVDPDSYHCPRCGTASDTDDFLTQDQLGYAQEIALQQFSPEVDQMLDDAFRGASSEFVSIERTGNTDLGSNPVPPDEPNDMMAVASPCHPFEPVKIPEDWNDTIHCLVCGSPFEI